MSSASLFDALDLPEEAHGLQDAYWVAKREWNALNARYHADLHGLLTRLGYEVPELNPRDALPGRPVCETCFGRVKAIVEAAFTRWHLHDVDNVVLIEQQILGDLVEAMKL